MIARRTVQVLVAVIAAFILSLSSADAQQVRMRWQDFISGPDGARRLASLMAAVAKMKSLDATDPVQDPVNYRRSWHYWANMQTPIFAMVAKYLRERPEEWGKTPDALVLAPLALAFPCGIKKS